MYPGRQIAIEFTSFLDDGTIIEDSSRHGKPFVFEFGSGQLFPYLEKEISTMLVNEVKKITLVPEDAYGPVRSELIQTMPKDALFGEHELQVGMQITMRVDEQRTMPARVVNVTQDMVTLDLNHPLAGKVIHYNVKVVAIN